ncbi:hypothetical protein SY88_21820 [Clostridiales bacterium PH28_bin88]|nr:hypothetical protein SY88_21820 [Clostridiales bacterium PH28_bin88]
MSKGNHSGQGRWTPAQWDAITVRDCNLLVSAAAGAGKTAVLVERIIRRLLDRKQPVDIDRMLVVTFTEAAAAEMRQRIGEALKKALEQEPENLHLHRQLALLNRAAVSTLHSFCLQAIRSHFYQLGLDPMFRVADDAEATLLRLEVAEDLFERKYAAEPEGGPFTDLAECYGGQRGDEGLMEIMLKVYDFARSHPSPREWLLRAAERFRLTAGTGLEDLPWTGTVLALVSFQLARAEAALVQALEAANRPGGPAAYRETLEQDLAVVRDLAQACAREKWDTLRELWLQAAFGRLPAVKSGTVDERLKQAVQDLRDEAKKLLGGLGEKYFARSSQELVTDLRVVGSRVAALVELVLDYDAAYSQAKASRGLVDFADLEHYCLQLLREQDHQGNPAPSPVALDMRSRFDEVLVDEYQDINGVQDAILSLVSRQDRQELPNLFMVGDVKQSIYRFRMAEPRLFLEKYQRYPDVPGGRERRVNLTANFRSRVGVIDAVNFLFRQVMTPGVGEMAYDLAAELTCGADYPEVAAVEGKTPSAAGPVEVHLVERQAPSGEGKEQVEPGADGLPAEVEAEGEENLEDLEALELEAMVIARRIREMVLGREFQVWDKGAGCYRPVSYRDIVILMRSTRVRANTLLEVFRRQDIPAYTELGTGYFAATEVETMLSLLRLIDNPRQDIPLVAVLRSPMVGLTAADLARVRTCGNGDFYSAVVAAARKKDLGDLSLRLEQFLKQLDEWRTAARRAPLGDLIWRIYRDTAYLDYAGGMPGGSQRQANLRALQDRARQSERFSRQGLFRFLRFVERLRDSEGDLGTARALGENEDVVRLMSIHKSKGLEFPVVFVADLGKQFNFRDLSGDVLVHRDLGIGAVLVDPGARIKYPTLAHTAIQQRCRVEGLAEELRVLYVALTRARERLVLVGSARDLARSCGKWCQAVAHRGWALPDGQLAAAQTHLDWVCGALARHADGDLLRSMGGCEHLPDDPEVRDDRSSWDLQVWGRHGGKQLETSLPQQVNQEVDWERVRRLEPLALPANPGLMAELERRLSWVSPRQVLAGKAAKVAVSEVKRRFDGGTVEEDTGLSLFRTGISSRPVFLQDNRGLSAAERGTVMHLVAQHLDLKRPLDEAGILDQVAAMVTRELLTPEQAAAVGVAELAAFFRSSLGQRLLDRREQVRRELPFSLGLPAVEVYPELPPLVAGEDRVLVQGIIDCLVDEGDGFLLVDFKTDRVMEGDLERVAASYRGQLRLYARAVEAIHRRPVKEAYLYFLTLGKEVRVPVRDAE